MAFNGLSLKHSFFLDDVFAHEIDTEQNTCVGSILSKMKTYHMEFDLESTIGRLPQCFVREFGDTIAPYLILQDPNKNEFEVQVIKKDDTIFFGNGWFRLKDVYDIPFGAWVTFRYSNPALLIISIANRWGEEVKYPAHIPPLRFMLPKVRLEVPTMSSHLPISSVVPLQRLTFVRTYVKEMTYSDIHSGTLALPWYGFGESAFAFVFSNLVLLDYKGTQFHCSLSYGVDANGELCCKVSNGWFDFCKANGLVEGSKVRFCVTQPVHGYTMYVCVYPQIGIQTTLSYPLNDGSVIPLYITQQYFLAQK